MNESDMNPVLAACPYLQVREPITFREWWLGPIDRFAGPWSSAELGAATGRFLRGFRDLSGHPIRNPTLLAHRDGGVNGSLPADKVREALVLTIQFVVLNSNPYWSESTSGDAWRVATSDNADLWFQPLDLAGGYVALARGSRVRTDSGGHRFTDPDFAVPPPLELHLPSPITLDAELAEALYITLTEPKPEAVDLAHRIRVCVRWLGKAWFNSASISDEDRVVHLKTASEGLTGSEKTHVARTYLVNLFNTTASQPGESIGVEDLLWSPNEPVFERIRRDNGQTEQVTALEHWFHALADARNEVVHRGAARTLIYEQEGSPYIGPLVDIGERVLREAITVALGISGFPAVWRRGITRGSFHAWERLSEDIGQS